MIRQFTHLTAVLAMAFVVALIPAATGLASSQEQGSDTLPIVEPGGRWDGDTEGSTEAQCFQLPDAVDGWMTIEASVPVDAAVQPKLGLFRRPEKTVNKDRSVIVHERSAASRTLWAGDQLVLCVAAQDPLLPLGPFTLHTVHMSSERLFRRDGGDPDDVDEDEIDPILLKAALAELCSPEELDDHSDFLSCASDIRLQQSLEGELRNTSGDDVDAFTFVVQRLTTVRIETSGDVTVRGALYDGNGRRLAVGPRSPDLRLVLTLAPGRYFVRLAGAGRVEGSYTLRVETLPW